MTVRRTGRNCYSLSVCFAITFRRGFCFLLPELRSNKPNPFQMRLPLRSDSRTFNNSSLYGSQSDKHCQPHCSYCFGLTRCQVKSRTVVKSCCTATVTEDHPHGNYIEPRDIGAPSISFSASIFVFSYGYNRQLFKSFTG